MKALRKLMRAVAKAAKAEYCKWFGWRVVIFWEGKTYRHSACTRNGILEWLAQYPPEVGAAVFEFDHVECGRREAFA